MSISWKSSPEYATCVTIARRTPKGMLTALQGALGVSRYAELRLDFLKPGHVPDALKMCRRHLKRCVCTIRPESQGGMFAESEASRRDLLRLASGYEPYRLDVEYDTIRRGKLAADLGAGILVSWHDFEKTPDAGALLQKMRRMSGYSAHVKMVATARTAMDASRILSLYGAAGDTELIAFCMGDMGKISRLVCLYLGAPYTYVSLGRAVAPGQYSLAEIKRLTAPVRT